MKMSGVIIEVSPCCDQSVNSHRSCKQSIFAIFLYKVKKSTFRSIDQTTGGYTRFRKEHKLGFLDNVYIIITVFVYMLTFERKIIVLKKLVM